MPSSRTLTVKQARRIALGAQGFADPLPGGTVDRRHVRRVLDRVKLLQIDSVNVLVRSHYLPLYSRLGAYPTELLDRLSRGRKRLLFEYWGHEASLIPLELQPLFRWRMEEARQGKGAYASLCRFASERPELLEKVLRRVGEDGPIDAGEVGGERGSGGWWGWSDTKQALEYLFWTGQVTTFARRRNFERLYALPERALPAEILSLPTPPKEDAQRQLLLLAADAMGVASETDFRAYFRMGVADTRARLAELVEAGSLEEVAVKGWKQPAYLNPAAHRPRRFERATLLSPFDSLVWDRDRCARLFGFHYRLEFYTPAEKRRFGYYVMPFLLGDRLVGRVDVKADRASCRLLVLGAFAESGEAPEKLAEPLFEQLTALASWLGLEAVRLEGEGDLVARMRDLRASRAPA